MKKFVASLFFVCFILLLAACGGTESTSDDGAGEPADTEEPAENGEDTTTESESETSFPEQNITLIVPFDAGGGTDATARALASAAEKHLGVSVGVVNRTGGGGAVGMSEGANAAPDGYTVTMVTVELATLPHLGLAPITYENFAGIGQMNFDPAAVTVPADAPYDTLEEFIEYAKENPGLQMGNSGTGSIWHLAGASIEQATGTEFNHVPYDGAAPAVTALLGGHIDVVPVSPAEVLTHVEAGTLKTLAVMSNERSPAMPDVPTFAELGIDAVAVGPWRGLTVPKDTPPEVIEVLTEAFSKGAQEEEFIEFMDNNGLGIVILDGPEFEAMMQESHDFYGELIPELGLNE
ncbi:tripartite tricarboxylate transporter substrate binding protein [Alkalihalobacillus oceani]|uniref:Tripartite tricarboxylate transporter substrate binding protein n=1 Tax=Halalkalibacter oceani TaxID=1653776 RepID=A0A9X2DSK4_9BACI|nr:tripartite tricarboxylate transporter substrate binding protein [Halalkalibacter oceani]MCM3715395.1 tripartite tricarboxylate transporter substrate binding protein [Halalkalibacter oceani]